MTQGQLMVGTNGTAGTGVYRLDFNRDTAYRYDVTNRTTGTNNLAKVMQPIGLGAVLILGKI